MSSVPDALSKMSRNCIIVPDTKSVLDALDKLDQASGSDAWYLVVTSAGGKFRIARFEQIHQYTSTNDPSLPTMTLSRVQDPLLEVESIDKDAPFSEAETRAKQNPAGAVVVTWKGSAVGVLSVQEAIAAAGVPPEAQAAVLAAAAPLEEVVAVVSPEISVNIGDDVSAPLNIAGDDVIITNITQVESELTGGPSWLIRAVRWAQSNVIVLALGFIVLAVIPTLITYSSLLPKPTQPMEGELNIVVVGFTPGSGVRARDASAIATAFYSRLNGDVAEISDGTELDIEVRGPNEVNALRGTTEEELATSAAALAEQINAHIVIYGLVTDTSSGVSVEPRFFVKLPNSYEAGQMTGDDGLGAPIEVDNTSLSTQIGVNNALSNRTEVMALLTKGLALFYSHQYEDALSAFEQANDDDRWPSDRRQREVLFVMQGNAAVRALLIDDAEAAYRAALEIEPEYSRAMIGLADVYYLRALDGVTNQRFYPDPVLLDQAVDSLRDAANAEIQPPAADVPTKIAAALGQIYILQWVAYGDDTHDLAIEQFNTIIATYDDGANPRVQELAAEAHARLALIAWRDSDLDTAISEYTAAINLSTAPYRRGLYWASLADLYSAQGRSEESGEANEKAIIQFEAAMELTRQGEVRAEYWSQIAKRYQALNDEAKAVHAWKQSARLAQSAAEAGAQIRGLRAAVSAHMELGRVEITLRNYDTAIADFQAAIDLSEHSSQRADAWDGLAAAYEAQGNTQAAIDALNQAVSGYTQAIEETTNEVLQQHYRDKIEEIQTHLETLS